MNPQRYAYPACAITVRFSAMMRLADYPCLLTSEPVTATLMTNIIALKPQEPAAPVRILQGLCWPPRSISGRSTTGRKRSDPVARGESR